MLLELARALSAALAVGLLPGWFWAAALAPCADRAERLAYSAGLSMALVPAAALVPARVLGLGVTLPVAVSSAALVLASGLVAFVLLGPAKGGDGPVLAPPRPLGGLALVLLLPALGLALGAALTDVVLDDPALAAIGLLVFFAGAVHLVGSRQGGEPGPPPEPPREPEVGTRLPAVRYVLLSGVVILALVRGYWGVVVHDWPFIRGVDHYSHAVMANRMISEGEIYPYLIYPPGFHTMTAMVSQLSGLGPLDIFPVLGPALLALPVLSLYALGKRLWGQTCGVVAAFFSVLLGGTYYYYNDAMYPNFVTSHFLLVLAIAALVMVCSRPSGRSGVLFALVGSSVVLYHQVASLYLALLLALVGALFLPYLLLRDRRRGVALLLSLGLVGALSVVYAWDTYDLGREIGGFVGGSGSSITGDAVGMAVGTQAPYSLEFLIGTMVTPPVALLGLLGALLLADGWRDRGSGRVVGAPQALALLAPLLWVLLLVAGSSTSLSGFPQRFGRDLGVPLALLAAPAFVAILRSLGPRARPAAVFVASLTVLTATTLVGLQAARSLEQAAGPSVQLTITPEIAAAGEWLGEHNDGGNIMVSPQANQVPSRMMLAMGNYSALQSYTEQNIQLNRDLPPGGAGPLWDVLWVMNHPGGGRTERLLKKYDVRHVVLYKDMPDRPVVGYWALFEARPDLYRTAFENGDVLIVQRRPTP